jgi:hypothetical protein
MIRVRIRAGTNRSQRKGRRDNIKKFTKKEKEE